MANTAHEPTDKQRTEAQAYATVGTPHHDIALLIGVSIKTLLKYYDTELKLGKARGNAEIAKTLFKTAKAGNLGAMCFWLKAQAGWRETQIVQKQFLDEDGEPISPVAPTAIVSVPIADIAEAARRYSDLMDAQE